MYHSHCNYPNNQYCNYNGCHRPGYGYGSNCHPMPMKYQYQNGCNQNQNGCKQINYILPPAVFFQEWSNGKLKTKGCITVTVVNFDTTVNYLDRDAIIPTERYVNTGSNTKTTALFQAVTPINYTSYNCEDFKEITLSFNLQNIDYLFKELGTDSSVVVDPISNNEKPLVVHLNPDKTQVTHKLTLELPEGDDMCYTLKQVMLVIKYVYTSTCQGITLTVSDINFNLIQCYNMIDTCDQEEEEVEADEPV